MSTFRDTKCRHFVLSQKASRSGIGYKFSNTKAQFFGKKHGSHILYVIGCRIFISEMRQFRFAELLHFSSSAKWHQLQLAVWLAVWLDGERVVGQRGWVSGRVGCGGCVRGEGRRRAWGVGGGQTKTPYFVIWCYSINSTFHWDVGFFYACSLQKRFRNTSSWRSHPFDRQEQVFDFRFFWSNRATQNPFYRNQVRTPFVTEVWGTIIRNKDICICKIQATRQKINTPTTETENPSRPRMRISGLFVKFTLM